MANQISLNQFYSSKFRLAAMPLVGGKCTASTKNRNASNLLENCLQYSKTNFWTQTYTLLGPAIGA